MAALLDFLKNKKEAERAKERQPEKKAEKVSVAKETPKAAKEPKPAKAAKKGMFSYEVVKEPHISEKGTNLSGMNKYVFKVRASANKPEIKKAVEGIYGVQVLAVNIVNIPKKKRRLGRVEGFKKGYSKAIVTVKEGQKIEFI